MSRERRSGSGARSQPELDLRIPDSLPIAAFAQEIEAKLGAHQVLVVCGETGSGKTTQLPKICLRAGRGDRAAIAHTQPRRIAARSLARRIAEETGADLGRQVGFKVRFTDRTSKQSRVQVMTDGILLAEVRSDPRLRRYDTIILDEAHERSLNIDFLLGYLHRLLPQRPDLRLVITSATIHPESFSSHFGGAPIVEVSGRGHPVEIRYRPLDDDNESDDSDQQAAAILAALQELRREGPGDTLVFLSGEREIRETQRYLARRLRQHDILPLYGRLSTQRQEAIFAPHRRQRVVLATNVAETSLTVPGIRYVIDPGLARISRFSPRAGVQRLPIEEISQASAIQRSGRCGRTAPGICIRLYSEESFAEREEFTAPEIRRTNLASVLLQMCLMDLGRMEDFPFVDPPHGGAVAQAARLLQELEALDDDGAITVVGRKMARLPVDPRFSRILIEGTERSCLAEALVVVAGLSVPDPRERPLDEAEAADEKHGQWQDPSSDFVALLNLWHALHDVAARPPRSRLRRFCNESFLSYRRVFEWRDVHRQLTQQCREAKIGEATSPAVRQVDKALYGRLHQSLLSGLLSHVGRRSEDDYGYEGCRGRSFFIFPGSGLFRSRPKWIVAAELVETSRLYGRTCARVQPAWIVEMASHRIERSYDDPRWDPESQRVMASERAVLYGLTLHARRPVAYEGIDPATARGVFIDEALVEEGLRSPPPFVVANREVVAAAAETEARLRRVQPLAPRSRLAARYDRRLPPEITGPEALRRWLRADPEQQHGLVVSESELLADTQNARPEDFPEIWSSEAGDLRLHYRFEPGDPADGVTLELPQQSLPRLPAAAFTWLVPGYRRELVEALLRTLPKRHRRSLQPLAATVETFLRDHTHSGNDLSRSLTDFVARRVGTAPERLDWSPQGAGERLPPHLRMNFRIVDAAGEVIGEGRDLGELVAAHGNRAQEAVSAEASHSGIERSGLVGWSFGPLEESIVLEMPGAPVAMVPALVDRRESVDLILVDDAAIAALLTLRGTARLLLLALPEQVKVARKLADAEWLLLYRRLPPDPRPPLRTEAKLEEGADDLLLAAAQELLLEHGLPRDEDSFAATTAALRGLLYGRARDLCESSAELLRLANQVRAEVERLEKAAQDDVGESLDLQLRWLLHRGFLSGFDSRTRRHFRRYLAAVSLRLEKRAVQPAKDRERAAIVEPHRRQFRDAAAGGRGCGGRLPDWRDLQAAIEELAVSVFAQELGTGRKVSPQRVERQWQLLDQA